MKRFRNLRKSKIRNFVRENHVTADDLWQPFFVLEGKGRREAISSMPGIERYSVDLLLKHVEDYIKLGGRAGILFGLSDHKDLLAKSAYNPKGAVPSAIRAIKKHFPDFLIVTDVCLCAYTTHGHCGVVAGHDVDNDKTLPILAKMALCHADAGADMVAPSDMMDFRVSAIGQALDKAGYKDVGILSYAVKYASAYYGPFREAAHSGAQFGDRKTYQMDPANSREALKEAYQDIDEGADMIMVKPALAYLDIVRQLRDRLTVPIVAYNVSGEYSMVKAAAQKGWVNEKDIVLESLLSMKRAGADIIITYHAKDAFEMVKTLKVSNSKKEFVRAQKVLVGGVNSPVRAFKGVGGQALLMNRGAGSKFYDIDGNAYTDYCLSWGALILGHAHKDVLAAINKTLKNGTSFGTTTKGEIELAETITKYIPSIDQIRFVNSGTEAVMSAIRLARGFTSRNKVLKFDGCYHGHCDDLLATAGSGVAFLASSTSRGVPPAHVQNTLSIPYNDTNELFHTIERLRRDIACVVIEPVSGNMGVVLPKKEFLKTLRDITKKYGIVLIFDEVMTGFRTNFGSAQADLGIEPDMTCLGKIIGGGFPIGAYGGRSDIMKRLAPLGDVYQAGTFAGNPVVMSAGIATLKNLNTKIYKNINEISENFAKTMNAHFIENNIPAHFSAYKGMMSLRFRKEEVIDYSGAQAASSSTIYPKLFHFLLNNGIYWPPADLEAFFVSNAHTAKDLTHLQNKLFEFFK